MQEAFEETGALKGVEVMGERVDNKELFKEWLCKQHKQDGNEYSANTISAYCSALSKSPEKLEGIDDDCKRSIFVYDDVGEFSIVHEIIKKAPNFDEVNKAAGNQAFKYGMIKYQEFLQQNSQGGPTMQGSDKKLNEYVDLLKSTKNLILTGAPGTGKTYLARQIAQAMGCSSQEIGFVQFHPSYDYTDFVEGLRPVQDESGSGQIGFERKDGVFKEFCARALQNLENQTMIDTDINSFDTAWNCLTNEVRENIADGKLTKIGIWEYSLSSTGSLKYSSKDTQSKYTFTITKQNVFDAWRGIKARPSGYFQKYMKEVADYMKKFGLSEYNPNKNLSNNKIKSFVFIIDEINRGEVAKIFGELFYSVDPGYRVTAKDIEEIKSGQKTITAIRTQYANLEADGNAFDNALNIIDENDYGHFFVPENVYIIGTMNDIDRSVESMDFAFRRRFAWVEVKASHTEDMLDKLNEFRPGLAEVAKNRMKRLNKAISETQDFGPAYHIGASYFLKLNQYEGNFERLWDYHIKGILEEYVRGNPNKTDLMEKFKAAYFPGKETSSEDEET